MIKKIIQIFVLLAFTLVLGEVRLSLKKEHQKYDITFYDDHVIKKQDVKIISKTKQQETLILDFQKDAYVLNEESFYCLQYENTEEYLLQGGVIIVNDKNVTKTALNVKIKTNTADFDYSNQDNAYGFYVFNNGYENIAVNVFLGYLTKSEQFNSINNELTKKINKGIIAHNLVESAINKKDLSFNAIYDNIGGDVSSSYTSGKIIATAFLENILYLDSSNEKACSYTIYTNVVDVAKIKDASGVTRGMYDVTTAFTLDAEPKFAIKDYEVKMENYNAILDASYLNSNTTTSVSLGGSIGFQGDVVSGNVNAGVSYTYTPDSQEITNNLPSGSKKYWKSNVINDDYDASRKLIPAIRILNNNDVNLTYEYSRVESFRIKDNGWWIFQNKYYMLDQYRKELGICWDNNGYVKQMVYTG